MTESKVSDRLSFLAKKFDIFETEEKELGAKLKKSEADFNVQLVKANDGKILALVSIRKILEEGERLSRNISVSIEVFSAMIAADPTVNKSCVQWMLNVFVRLLKSGKAESISQAIRFVVEDLPQASSYISLFEGNKRKKKFAELCKGSYVLMNVEDPTDINQYKSLSQLFDAVDPFIERNPTELESLLMRYVNSGQAEIPVKDRKFTLYIPKTVNASEVFENFASWCTARKGNGNFESYKNNLRPDGRKSDIYIILNNKFFTGESQEIYQIHFESGQIKDRHNSQNISIFESVISESEGITNYFHKDLMDMAKLCKTGLDNNKYLDFLISFGFCESLFELIDENAPAIKFMNREIPRMPDMTKFKMIDSIIITDAKMVELHPSIGSLTNLELLCLTGNRIKSLPREIGLLKNLTFMNLTGNPIQDIPQEIGYLDKSKGGSLFRLSVRESDIGKENYKKLLELLPTTKINSSKE